MECGADGMAEGVKRELEASYARHGCGPEFWNTYQRVLNQLTSGGQRSSGLADQLALTIEELGMVRRAVLLGQDGQPR